MIRRIIIFEAELLLLLANPNRLNSATLRIVYDTSIIFFFHILFLKTANKTVPNRIRI